MLYVDTFDSPLIKATFITKTLHVTLCYMMVFPCRVFTLPCL